MWKCPFEVRRIPFLLLAPCVRRAPFFHGNHTPLFSSTGVLPPLLQTPVALLSPSPPKRFFWVGVSFNFTAASFRVPSLPPAMMRPSPLIGCDILPFDHAIRDPALVCPFPSGPPLPISLDGTIFFIRADIPPFFGGMKRRFPLFFFFFFLREIGASFFPSVWPLFWDIRDAFLVNVQRNGLFFFFCNIRRTKRVPSFFPPEMR